MKEGINYSAQVVQVIDKLRAKYGEQDNPKGATAREKGFCSRSPVADAI